MTTLRFKDIIGPIMVGPSSSHTAGALRIAFMARQLCNAPLRRVEFRLFGSFAQTYHGHGTDRALVAGILGLATDDIRIRSSIELASSKGIECVFTPLPQASCDHPNTVEIVMTDSNDHTVEVRGISIGGGMALLTRINDVDLSISGERTSLVIKQRDSVGVLAHITHCISEHNINIATTRLYRERKGSVAVTIVETDAPIPADLQRDIESAPDIQLLRVIPAIDIVADTDECDAKALSFAQSVDFTSADDIQTWCVQHDNASLAKAFRTREYACAKAEGTSEDTDDYANKVLEVMHSSLMLPLDKPLKTMGGLISGTTHTLVEHMPASQICDDQLAHLIIYSMAVLETNASMGRIVAAPTAGSAGVIPAVLHLMREQGHTNDQLREGLYAAAAIGYLVTRNATVSGAEGGCQAEVGTASAMGAAAIVQIAGGSAAQCFDAAATALSNSMGLVCDPIGGLVEAPCQRRNAMGAANAFIGAQISLAHIPNLVPFDETVQALYKVGQSLPFELRESALGGLAATPTACAWCETRNSHHGCKSAQ